MRRVSSLLMLLLLLWLPPGACFAKGAYSYRFPEKKEGIDPAANTVIGAFQDYGVAKDDTLLDVARNFDLGYNELVLDYPEIDPWLPPAGEKLSIPTEWILPPLNSKGIVINVPELRLYLYYPDIHMVKTYPIGIGVLDAPTPLGRFTIIEKTKDPTWKIPLELQEEYGRKSMPPGPDNPLGAYRLRLSQYDVGIHGTNIPWGVGRLVSHGCIRLYPEDIEELFYEVPVGTHVEIIYEPVKLGFQGGHIFVEVHPDLYNVIPDLHLYTARKLFIRHLWEEVDVSLLSKALAERKGVPVDITRKK